MHGLLAIRDLRYLRPLQFKLPAAPTRRIMACTASWHSLGTPRGELVLDNTLPTGQSFRWRRTGSSMYTGVIGQRLVQVQQTEEDVQYRVLARGPDTPAAEDAAALHDYFNLGTNLLQLSEAWAAADPRFAHIQQYIPGARMLRQDPVECLFQFICSSNNHISRIHGMVERLCSSYGTPLVPTHPVDDSTEGGGLKEPPTPPAISNPAAAAAADGGVGGGSKQSSSKTTRTKVATSSSSSSKPGPTSAAAGAGPSAPAAYFAFPTLQQLAAATEEDLRGAGFGYRAKFITGSVAQLLAQPGGGEAWLLGLRQVPYQEAVEQLITLPGIGPKVAACVALFSLDKHQAVPVDTHVWQLATRHYAPRLAGKSLTTKLHGEVQRAFEEVFGPYAGWAHNTLFIAELASHRGLVPQLPKASTATAAAAGSAGKEAGALSPAGSGSMSGLSSSSAGDDAADGGSGDEWQPVRTPGKPAAAADAAIGDTGRDVAEAAQRPKRKRQPSAKAAGRAKGGRGSTTAVAAAGGGVEVPRTKRSKKMDAVAAAQHSAQVPLQQQQQRDAGVKDEEVPLPLQALPPAAAGAAQAQRTRRLQCQAQAAAADGTGSPVLHHRVVAAGQLLAAVKEEVYNTPSALAAGTATTATATEAAAEEEVLVDHKQKVVSGAAQQHGKEQRQQALDRQAVSSSPGCAAAIQHWSWVEGTMGVPVTPLGLGSSAGAPAMEGSPPGVAVLVSAGTGVGGSDG